MRFAILGPLRMTGVGAPTVPKAPKQRQLLALLLLNANQVVPVGVCIKELWDDQPPDSALSTLQTYVLHLRRVLCGVPEIGTMRAAKQVLATAERGYRFSVPDGSLDLHLFDEGVRKARDALADGDDARGSALLARALDMWEGRALTGVQAGPVLRAHAAMLEEYRLSVQETRIEADLRLARHHELIGELSALATRHPTNENVRAQLMLALYRSGRQAHAVEAYQRLRRTLSADLGLDPSPRMRRFLQAMLENHPSLNSPAAAGAGAAGDRSA
ncbi:AfsR/SARP family transcriptional regulator [Streptodolium elevatio]|uniref:AfsR/SARP family transcriptional regulator n=1 Tax=Streptodolium elevatio TaxID=3157996 RepID=A0ABV3DRF7_9ACTN